MRVLFRSYGFPYYFSPYPYYQPYRYRPYYGPFQSSYYHSGFGAAYAYGGFSGYRDYGYPYFSHRFAYRDHDRYRDRYGNHDDHDDYGRDERDDHDRNRRQHDGADRVGDLPIVARRDARLPFYGNDPRHRRDRTSGVKGKSVSVRVDLGGCRILKKKKNKQKHTTT